jgi:hypothetical protein
LRFSTYKVNRKHRDQTAKHNCTQWTISEWDEIRLFSVAKTNEWKCIKNCLWAIEKEDGDFSELGKTDKYTAFIAKYVVDNNQEWHGYPVTPSRDADRPPTEILDSWRSKNIISKAQQGKIIKGKW